MPREEFTIRITKKGEVIVELDGMPVRRVKDLMAYLEETIGPARQLLDGDDPTGSASVPIEDLTGLEGESEAATEEEAPRLRLQDGE
jgi:hypothetical protein